jgi:hypothetical protein
MAVEAADAAAERVAVAAAYAAAVAAKVADAAAERVAVAAAYAAAVAAKVAVGVAAGATAAETVEATAGCSSDHRDDQNDREQLCPCPSLHVQAH